MNTSTKNTSDKRIRAYRAGARFTRERMAREAPLDAEALERVSPADIIAVDGTYDHVEQVLSALELPYTTVTPGQVSRLQLRPEQLLVDNCPGNIDPRGLFNIKTFVEEGGDLFTTDWSSA